MSLINKHCRICDEVTTHVVFNDRMKCEECDNTIRFDLNHEPKKRF